MTIRNLHEPGRLPISLPECAAYEPHAIGLVVTWWVAEGVASFWG